jgi:hypothetical protein
MMVSFTEYLARRHGIDPEGLTDDEIFDKCLQVSKGEYGVVDKDGEFKPLPVEGRKVGTNDGVIREVGTVRGEK